MIILINISIIDTGHQQRIYQEKVASYFFAPFLLIIIHEPFLD